MGDFCCVWSHVVVKLDVSFFLNKLLVLFLELDFYYSFFFILLNILFLLRWTEKVAKTETLCEF